MIKKSWILSIFTVGLIIVLFLIFRSVLTFLAVSAVFTLVSRPLFLSLKQIKIKTFSLNSSLAAILTMLTFYSAVFVFLALFIPSIAKETQMITKINPKELMKSLEQPISNMEGMIMDFTGDKISIHSYLNEKLTSIINISTISDWVNILSGVTGDIFISFFAISFITFFFIKDSRLIIHNIYSIIPYTFRDETDIVMSEVKTKLSRYFVGICIEVFLVFTVNAIGLWSINVNSFLVIALFAGIINVIPYVGPLIGILFGCAIVLTTNNELPFLEELLPLIGYTALVMAFTQLLDNLILQPLIYSNSVNAHPLEIFLVILIAGNSYGIIGMIVAIPIYSVIRVLIKEFRGNSKFLNEIYVSKNND